MRSVRKSGYARVGAPSPRVASKTRVVVSDRLNIRNSGFMGNMPDTVISIERERIGEATGVAGRVV